MQVRVGLVALLLLGVAMPEALGGRQVCRIVEDARGDAEYPSNGVPGDAGDDLLSADLASDGKQLTAVWRLAAVRTPNPAAPLGQDFVTFFHAPGTRSRLFVRASTGASGPSFDFGHVEPGTPLPRIRVVGSARGVVDPARREVRLTTATRGFAVTRAVFRPGGRLRSLLVVSGRRASPVPGSALDDVQRHFAFDEADGAAYVIGTPSCARPVR